MKIAIQGGEASFHDMAAREHFTDSAIDLIQCWTFRQQCTELAKGHADRAVMAIENSLAGSMLPNYGLLEEFPITIVGEIYLQIQQHLMALRGQQLSDIETERVAEKRLWHTGCHIAQEVGLIAGPGELVGRSAE